MFAIQPKLATPQLESRHIFDLGIQYGFLLGKILEAEDIRIREHARIQPRFPRGDAAGEWREVAGLDPLGVPNIGTFDHHLLAGCRFVGDHLFRRRSSARGSDPFPVNSRVNDHAFAGLEHLGGFANCFPWPYLIARTLIRGSAMALPDMIGFRELQRFLPRFEFRPIRKFDRSKFGGGLDWQNTHSQRGHGAWNDT